MPRCPGPWCGLQQHVTNMHRLAALLALLTLLPAAGPTRCRPKRELLAHGLRLCLSLSILPVLHENGRAERNIHPACIVCRPKSPESKVVVCYYPSWGQFTSGIGTFVPSDLDPSLCSHVIFAFMAIASNGQVSHLA